MPDRLPADTDADRRRADCAKQEDQAGAPRTRRREYRRTQGIRVRNPEVTRGIELWGDWIAGPGGDSQTGSKSQTRKLSNGRGDRVMTHGP
jgi:hypothetical protein